MFEKAKRSTQSAPVLPYLLKQSGYMYIGLFSLVALILVDLWFVSRLGTTALKVLSFSTPVTMGAVSILLALGTAITALASLLAGDEDRDRSYSYHRTAILSSLGLGVLLCMGGYLAHNLLFTLLGIEPDLFSLSRQYMYPLYLALIPASLATGLLSIFRAQGDQRLPGVLFFTAMVINIGLDPLLIFGWRSIPGFGLSGAALATLIALSITCMISMFLYLKAGFPLTFTPPDNWRRHLEKSWNLFWPAALSRISLPFISAILIALLARINENAVTAYGIAYRFDLLVMMFPIALSNALAPFVGQLQGAGKLERMQEGIRKALWILVIYAVIASLLFVFGSGFISSTYTSHDRVGHFIRLYYLIIPWGWIFQFLMMLSAGLLYVFQKPLYALLLLGIQLFLVYLPLWGVATYGENIQLFFLSFPIANLLAGLTGWYFMRKFARKTVSNNEPEKVGRIT